MIRIDKTVALEERKKQKTALLKAAWAEYIISGNFSTMDEANLKFNGFHQSIRNSRSKSELEKIPINFNS